MNLLKRIADKIRNKPEPTEEVFRPLSVPACIQYLEGQIALHSRTASSRRNRKSQDAKAVRKVHTLAALQISMRDHLRELEILKTTQGHGK